MDLNNLISKEEFNKEWIEQKYENVALYVKRPERYTEYPKFNDRSEYYIETYHNWGRLSEKEMFKYWFRRIYNYIRICAFNDFCLCDLDYDDRDEEEIKKKFKSFGSLFDYIPVLLIDHNLILVNCNADSENVGKVCIQTYDDHNRIGIFNVDENLNDLLEIIADIEEEPRSAADRYLSRNNFPLHYG